MVRILVDADACPVKEIIVKKAKEKSIEVLMFVDVNHHISDSYSKVFVCDQGRDSVDFILIANISAGDIVVTQDYGVAAIALAKKAKVIHPGGLVFSDNNIEGLLNERFMSQKQRRTGNYKSFAKKRSPRENDSFSVSFSKILNAE
jgi:uncharacterized protein